MTTRSDPLHELVRLVAVAIGPSSELGPFIERHPDLVAQILSVSVPVALSMAHLDDRSLVPLLEGALERYLDARRQAWREKKEERACQAAHLLGKRARWQGGRAWLDVALLFGEVLSTAARHVLFSASTFEIAVSRRKLLEVRSALARQKDVELFVDGRGIHFRWRGGKGQLNFLPHHLERGEVSVLVVALSPSPPPSASAMLAGPSGPALPACGLVLPDGRSRRPRTPASETPSAFPRGSTLAQRRVPSGRLEPLRRTGATTGPPGLVVPVLFPFWRRR